MPSAIRIASIISAYDTTYRYSYANPNTRSSPTKDKVEFSQEALDKVKNLRLEQQRAEEQEKAPAFTDNELKESLDTLKVGKNASSDEIRKAYLYAIRNYHPDKFEGLPPEFRKLAEEKTKEITTAYNRLKNE
jgi:DnaJ-domain-containing protein 1